MINSILWITRHGEEPTVAFTVPFDCRGIGKQLMVMHWL